MASPLLSFFLLSLHQPLFLSPFSYFLLIFPTFRFSFFSFTPLILPCLLAFSFPLYVSLTSSLLHSSGCLFFPLYVFFLPHLASVIPTLPFFLSSHYTYPSIQAWNATSNLAHHFLHSHICWLDLQFHFTATVIPFLQHCSVAASISSSFLLHLSIIASIRP